jgi:hypothetical protein
MAARLTELQINTFVDEMKSLNEHINTHGKISRSTYIKHFHSLVNEEWARILEVAVVCDHLGIMPLTSYTIRDCEQLYEIIKTGHSHGDNLLCPSPKQESRLPRALREMPHSNKTVKSTVWRLMMTLREAYCDVLGIDLPNEDSSIGLLDPKPKDQLFEF